MSSGNYPNKYFKTQRNSNLINGLNIKQKIFKRKGAKTQRRKARRKYL